MYEDVTYPNSKEIDSSLLQERLFQTTNIARKQSSYKAKKEI